MWCDPRGRSKLVLASLLTENASKSWSPSRNRASVVGANESFQKWQMEKIVTYY